MTAAVQGDNSRLLPAADHSSNGWLKTCTLWRGQDRRHRRRHRSASTRVAPAAAGRFTITPNVFERYAGLLKPAPGARRACQRDHASPFQRGRDHTEGAETGRCPTSLGHTEGDRPVDKRDRAILMLFVAYGLRAGEVGGLRLDDLDWENEMIRVRCPEAWPDTYLSFIARGRSAQFCATSGKAGHRASAGRYSSRSRAPIRPLDRRRSRARSCVIAWPAIGIVVRRSREPMRCGMPRPSIFWTRACR